MSEFTIPTLETPRLILRAFRLEDAPQVQKLAGAIEVARTTLNVPHPYEEGMAEAWIGTHQELFESGHAATFAVTLRESRALIGAIGLGRDARFNRAELGYWITPLQWGQGFGSEAARAVVDWGFSVWGLQKIHATHLKFNPASGRVMQKIGMTHEGCLREHIEKWGERHDLECYGVLRSEWK